MFNHVADLVAIGLVPAKVVVTGVDNEDVILFDLDPFLDHGWRVDVVVAGGLRQVDDDPLVYEEVEVEFGDVLARREEVDLPVEVCTDVVGVRQQLTVRPVRRQSLEVLHLQRLVRRPRRRRDRQRK